jgi:hypothetical protein
VVYLGEIQMIKLLMGLILLGNIATSAIAESSKNPYINKNLSTHTQEFLAYEMITDFHQGVRNYNLQRKDLPEAQLINNHYEIKDGKNKLAFSINLALKGDFFYNEMHTNLNEHKLDAIPKTVLLHFISDAEAATPNHLSTVLLAALIKLDSTINPNNSMGKNRELLKNKINTIYLECRDQDNALATIDHTNVQNMENLLKQININARANSMIDITSEEFSIVKNHLRKGEEPNCSNVAKSAIAEWANGLGLTQTQRAIASQVNSGNGVEIIAAGGEQAVLSPEAQKNIWSDQELCTQLAQLKSCLASKDTSLMDVRGSSTSRQYLKEIPDDLKDYYISVDPNKKSEAVYH